MHKKESILKHLRIKEINLDMLCYCYMYFRYCMLLDILPVLSKIFKKLTEEDNKNPHILNNINP